MLDKLPVARAVSLEVLNDASITYRYTAPVGHTLDMCLRPDYWTHLTRELGAQRVESRHAYNRIEILAEDNSWEAELRVLSVADGLVHTRCIREWTAPAKPGRKPSLPDGYKVEHVPGNGWRALDANGGVIVGKLATEEDAIRAASGHARKVKGD